MNSVPLSGPLSSSTSKPPEGWQRDAVAAWLASRHPSRGPCHGIVEAATGLGKSILAMTCMVEASRLRPELRFVVVVPNRNLARQWVDDLTEWFQLPSDAVGKCWTGEHGTLDRHRVLVVVINSARRHLPALCRGKAVMLVVDECHASASASNRDIYKAQTVFRLGISATAQVPGEVDEFGVLLPLNRQPHALELGPLCYRMDFGRADALGLLPPFRIVHHGLALSRTAPRGGISELERYEQLTYTFNQAVQVAEGLGVQLGRVWAIARRRAGGRWSADQVAAAKSVDSAARKRKQFLFLLPARNRIAKLLAQQAFGDANTAGQDLQMLLFNERVRLSAGELEAEEERAGRVVERSRDAEVDELEEEEDEQDDPLEEDDVLEPVLFAFQGAEQLHEMLAEAHRKGELLIRGRTAEVVRGTYSGCEDSGAIPSMRGEEGQPGRARVLVTAKAANQGVNLPNVDVGIIVASSSSVLQRVQTLGRILRARWEGGQRIPREAYARHFPKTLHVIYVKDTADEEIYLKTDWDEMLGRERNDWLYWEAGAETPVPDGTPPVPPMSEAEAWAWVQAQQAGGASYPILWPSRRPPNQPLSFKHNHVRVMSPSGKAGRNSPIVHNDAEIQRIVGDIARRCRLDPVSLRGAMAVTVNHRLLLRPAVDGLLTGPAIDPRTGRPLKGAMVVLGQLAELPVIGPDASEDQVKTPAERLRPERAGPERSESERFGGALRPVARGVNARNAEPDPAWYAPMRAFVRNGGAACIDSGDAPPTVANLLREGARDARLPPLDRLLAAKPEHVFAGWARATALGDAGRARELEGELQRRVAAEATVYYRAVRAVGAG